jgi:hypothetical protein
MSRRTPRLASVLRYRNARVLDDFLARYRLPRADAQELFDDVLRFLWVAERAAALGHESFPILRPQLLLDEMWHTFLLRTRDYERFCARYFGGFCHHLPAPKRGKQTPLTRDDLARVLDLVVAELGMGVAVRWYRTYARRYPPERIDRLRRPTR